MARPEDVLTDDLWDIMRPLLPREKPPGTPGRPQVPNRVAMLGILYVLLNGCAWNALPREYGSGPSCWRRLRDWQRKGDLEEGLEGRAGEGEARHEARPDGY